MKKTFTTILLLVSLTVLFFPACKSGTADKDGHETMEGPADPANNGGALSGDHIDHTKDSVSVNKDSLNK